MKKSVLALALFGAFASAASAQTSVTIYGIVDAAVAREDKGAAALLSTGAVDPAKPGGKFTRLDSGGQSGSRLGFKGTEDLGNGLSAIFQLENGFNIDNGRLGQGDRLFGRQAWVGLSGNFGALKLGRQNTPLRTAIESIDPFALGMAGSLDRFFSPAGSDGFRMDNTVNYSLPGNLGGFFGQVAYGFGEGANDTSAQRQIGLSTGYANGPVNVLVAYHNTNGTAALGGSTKVTLVGGTYDFTVVKAHLGYAQNKANTAVATTDDSRDMLAGVSAPFGASSLIASYIKHDTRGVGDRDWNAISVGYTYSLSKRTNFYTSYGRVSNDSGVAKLVDRNGEDYSLFNVGVRHKF
ncbi:MAG: porin [Paucimonas sp.]|jgi:predicted porin|nr:porin [Paucimonas sp.]